MAKIKTTRKEIVDRFCNVRSCGYCDASYLLNNHTPIAYTCGVYGWNFDVFEVYGVTICTGYRGMPGKRLEKLQEYEQMARDIHEDYTIPYNVRQEAIEKLLVEFCKINGGHESRF